VHALVFDDIVKRFPDARRNAVDHVSLSIAEGEFVTLVGTSGCGKTTLLKMVNRLYEPDGGTVRLFGEDISTKDAVRLRHGIGYVIQQAGLFPHMTVFENIAVVPRILKWDATRIKKRVEELLTLVRLDPAEFQKRHPSALSGGQQQRVGLARAMAAEPAVMLLDEPFGAIDAINRASLQNELLQIHQKHRRTYLFVTHDVGEAFKLGNRVLIMHQGTVQQFDTPDAIVHKPANDFVRELIASSGAVSGQTRGGDGA
jgi:osmoprotectant transport system ATP-binding protein